MVSADEIEHGAERLAGRRAKPTSELLEEQGRLSVGRSMRILSTTGMSTPSLNRSTENTSRALASSITVLAPCARDCRIVYSVHATKKLVDRVKQRPQPAVAEPSSMLGNWYATFVGWRPQVALLVNERTLLPVLMPLAPAATMLERFPAELAAVLRALEVPDEFIVQELAAMGHGVFAKTANRSVVGSMNEFVFLAEAWRDGGRTDDLLTMSRYLADVPCSPLDKSHGFPDREVAALVERWRAGEVTRGPPAAARTPVEGPDPEIPERPDPRAVRNQRRSGDLTRFDVDTALTRIDARSPDRASEARHVNDTLTWGEGPEQLTQSVVQDWLWYRLPTKYMTDEAGYMSRLAEIAAELFDELGLDGYAAICRSQATGDVHSAFDRSREDGYAAMRDALGRSGIEPPETESFAWGDVMGVEESMARSSVEFALEHAIDAGDLVVGGRGWRTRQKALTDATLDSDHPSQPGQTWRTAIATERIGSWIDEGLRRSGELGRLRSGIANRLLHPIATPSDAVERMAPLLWLLDLFGEEQALTQAGYLNRRFVLAVRAGRPWQDPFDTGRPPRTETDEISLHRLRGFLQRAGALRKRGRVLKRTKRGEAMAGDSAVAWSAVVRCFDTDPWSRFVTESYGLVLLGRGGPVHEKELRRMVVALAGEAGWRIGGTAGSGPSDREVAWAFSDTRALMGVLGLLEEDGDWSHRRYTLTSAGEVTVLAMLRETAAGPRDRP